MTTNTTPTLTALDLSHPRPLDDPRHRQRDRRGGRLRSLRTDADGDHVKLAANIIASIEHPEV